MRTARRSTRDVCCLAHVELRTKRYLVASIAGIIVTIAASPAAAATLRGPAQLRVLQKLTYRATGLPPGNYALIIKRDARGARCIAHLAAQRHAAGTVRFYGSLPDTLHCVRETRHFTARCIQARIASSCAATEATTTPPPAARSASSREHRCRRRLDVVLNDAAPDGALAALSAYRNPDGGYGWGLEADLRATESQPGAALHAFEVFEDILPATSPQVCGHITVRALSILKRHRMI